MNTDFWKGFGVAVLSIALLYLSGVLTDNGDGRHDIIIRGLS